MTSVLITAVLMAGGERTPELVILCVQFWPFPDLAFLVVTIWSLWKGEASKVVKTHTL